MKNSDIEEERRLAYVGITRGKEQVYLLSSYKRMLMGNDWYHNISTFLIEIKEDIEILITQTIDFMAKAMIFKLKDANLKFSVISKKTEKVINATNHSFRFLISEIIFHQKLGNGVITNKSGSNETTMYTIRFSTGVKTLMAKFAPIKKIAE